jgi:PAS domain S-box-containing protein
MQGLRVASIQRSAAVLGPALLIAGFALVLILALQDVLIQRDWVAYSQARVGLLAAVREHALEAETSKKGYLLTRDSSYLGPFVQSWAAAHRKLEQLRGLAAADPVHAGHVATLTELLRMRQDLAEQLLAASRGGQDETLALQFAAGRQGMAALDAFIDELQLDETSALAARQDAVAERLRWLMAFVVLAGAAAGALALLTNILIARQLAALRKSEAEQKAVLSELEEARSTLRMAVDSAGLGLWELDVQTGLAWWDARTREVLGRPGQGWVPAEEAASVIHPEDAGSALETFARTVAPGSDDTYRIDKRIVRPDGTVRWTVWTALLRRAADGAPLRLVGMLDDVTEIHDSRERLRESEERFRIMAEALPQIVWTAGPDGTVDFYNERWREFTGTPGEAGVGDGWRMIVHEEHEAATVEAWQRAVRTGEPYDVEHLVRRADGEYRWLLSRGVPLRDKGGNVVRWFGTATDIHEQKLAEAELRDARDAAEAASRAKSRFLAVISHELRTPLTAIIGFADLLETGVLGPLEKQQRESLGRITASSWGLVQIIDEILTFSTAEAGREQVRPQVLDVVDLAGGVASLFQLQAARQGLQLEFSTSSPCLSLLSDAGKVRQILINIIGNALKFTDQGKVSLEVRAAANGAVEVLVRDTGPGIPADQHDLIFEPFTQADQSSTRVKGGTGLGLAVSRRLARLLGGDVTVESVPGQGSTFRLWLPHLTVQPLREPVPTDDAVAGATDS